MTIDRFLHIRVGSQAIRQGDIVYLDGDNLARRVPRNYKSLDAINGWLQRRGGRVLGFASADAASNGMARVQVEGVFKD